MLRRPWCGAGSRAGLFNTDGECVVNYDYPFTESDMQQAVDEWSCSCGPSALAFALQVPLSEVRGKIPGFEDRGYTSPTMMKSALGEMGVRFEAAPVTDYQLAPEQMFRPQIALCRIQWTGPWTRPGANPKWSYRQTHWIACWREKIALTAEEIKSRPGIPSALDARLVFDCNGGIRPFSSWEKEIVPAITATYPRADGGWFPANIWRLLPR